MTSGLLSVKLLSNEYMMMMTRLVDCSTGLVCERRRMSIYHG